MPFTSEAEFESALVGLLSSEYGWSDGVLSNPTEQDLIKNWADILFQNNRGIDRLNDYPLTDGEMGQILEQIASLRTPLRLNGFINGKTVSIKRDNPDDGLHFGKEVSLKIYDRSEIAAGQSRYQIARQPRFKAKSEMLNSRRGDVMLLINGMPVIHIELKRSGVPIGQACNQIGKYSAEGVFSGLFSLVQVFFAMNPEEAVYFANPGPDGKFDPDFFFHWADFNNMPVDDWKSVARDLLSIPMAHRMIGFYTVADAYDGTLKVMRSYQVYAAQKISDRVAMTKWGEGSQRGGFVWHTTGSGKTLTSFKSAQLIAASGDADKVVFLVDRIELGTQSLDRYKDFADAAETVRGTEDTRELVHALKSPDPADTLIVTSIQKMSRIHDDADGLRAADLAAMRKKRIVFIVDECHRSVFGENMMPRIKRTFPDAVFFGFSGTPIQDENSKKDTVTATIFGDELHEYNIADGIRDGNVLGFDPYKVLTYKDIDVRRKIALEKAKASDEAEALADPAKRAKYYEYMDRPMAGHEEPDGSYVKGIEDYLPVSQYECGEHRTKVVEDIRDSWTTLSRGGRFHAIFATSSIPEAITYYGMIKDMIPDMKVTALFDPSIDNNGGAVFKEENLARIISDYNASYGQKFDIPGFHRMKKDIAARLSHSVPYGAVGKNRDMAIDLLIVVDQMLTGFDSKWVNTLYLDKMLEYENVIQAFSRTNRLAGPEKPFGTIRYYRKPHTMEKRVEAAVRLYSGGKPLALFAERLDRNIEGMNSVFSAIRDLFGRAGVDGFSDLPPETADRKKFVALFKDFNRYLEAAVVQGFSWDKRTYAVEDGNGGTRIIDVVPELFEYEALARRYKDLASAQGSGGSGGEPPYDIQGYLTAIETGRIDAEYMDAKFEKYVKLLRGGADKDAIEAAEDELHRSFALLSREEQKFADVFLHDLQSGDVAIEAGKTFRDYVAEYMRVAEDDRVHRVADRFGLDEEKLRALIAAYAPGSNIDEFGRFGDLKATVDMDKASAYFGAAEGKPLPRFRVSARVDRFLRNFIENGGKDVET